MVSCCRKMIVIIFECLHVLTCCEDFDTDDEFVVDEFKRFCRVVKPFAGKELDGLFLLKFSIIDAISFGIVGGVLLAIIDSGISDICGETEMKHN